jgi:urease accessory protein
MTAKLWLEFSRSSTATLLRVRRQEVPWRVLRGFPNASGETLAHLNNISGGVLDRDDLEMRIEVNRGARAQITSTGATRIYRSRSAAPGGRSRTEVEIGADGFLEYLPDALIPYAGSRYEQSTRIRLGPGATLVWWEIVSPGREAAGEVFRYARLASRLEILTRHGPLLEERWDLSPTAHPLDSAARLGPFRHFASLYLCREGAPDALWRGLEADLGRLAAGQSAENELLWGASSLCADGVALRGVARNGRLLARSLTAIWEAAKPALCGRVATPPRKIY